MPTETQNPSIVQTICESLVILGMYVNDSVLELIERANVVDLLPNQMRGVKVETKVPAPDRIEHTPPHLWRDSQAFAASPLIIAEQHRTIFYRHLNVVIVGKRNQRVPKRLE